MYYRTILSLSIPFALFLVCFCRPDGSAFAMDILPNGFLCPTQCDARNCNTAKDKLLVSTIRFAAEVAPTQALAITSPVPKVIVAQLQIHARNE
jgi:hypothetical protein